MNYTNEEKDKMVKTYFKLQKSEVPVSVRPYAAHVGVKYYTFRDWYRGYKARTEKIPIQLAKKLVLDTNTKLDKEEVAKGIKARRNLSL